MSDRISSYLRPRLPDIVGGVTAAAIVVPQSLAYAQLAGMPADRGLFAAAIPPLVAAPFLSSPYLQTGPTAVSALLTYGALNTLAIPGTPHYIELGLLLALLVGIIRVAVGFLKAGVLAHLMSQPLLVGFMPAAAIIIVAAQIPVFLGVEAPGKQDLVRAGWALTHVSSWHVEGTVIGVLVILVLVIGRRLAPAIPVTLIAVIVATVYGTLAGYTGAIVGQIPARLPPVTTSLPLPQIRDLMVPALNIALVGFVEATTIARTYAAIERRRWEPDREFISQGIANLGAGILGGFPVGASLARSEVNRRAGAKTSLSSLVTGLAVLAFLPFAFLLSPLPRSVLAAIVIVTAAALVRVDPVIRLARLSLPQFLVAASTFVLTLALTPHIEWAVLAGIGFTIGVHLWRELSLEVPSWADRDAIHLKPRGVLWFGTAARLQEDFLARATERKELQRLVLHLDGLGRIDITGALALREVLDEARLAGLEIEIIDVPPHLRRLVERVVTAADDPLRRP